MRSSIGKTSRWVNRGGPVRARRPVVRLKTAGRDLGAGSAQPHPEVVNLPVGTGIAPEAGLGIGDGASVAERQ